MKGQAAVEYVFTYGVAIFALVIIIGFILASGVLTPSQLIAEECSFGTNFRCNSAVFTEAGDTKLNFELYNGFPYEVRILDIDISTRDGDPLSGFPGERNLQSGEHHPYSFTLTAREFPPNNVVRFYGNITYVSCASEVSEPGGCGTNPHTVSGIIIGRIISD